MILVDAGAAPAGFGATDACCLPDDLGRLDVVAGVDFGPVHFPALFDVRERDKFLHTLCRLARRRPLLLGCHARRLVGHRLEIAPFLVEARFVAFHVEAVAHRSPTNASRPTLSEDTMPCISLGAGSFASRTVMLLSSKARSVCFCRRWSSRTLKKSDGAASHQTKLQGISFAAHRQSVAKCLLGAGTMRLLSCFRRAGGSSRADYGARGPSYRDRALELAEGPSRVIWI